jgi:tetratricopeptide (TPR) repeat protein
MPNRLVIFFLLAVLLGGYLLLASRREPNSWNGQCVVMRQGDTEVLLDDTGRKKAIGKLKKALATVIEEEGDWLRLRTREGTEGWLEKNKVVLLTEAIPFFTEQIRRNPNYANAYNLRAVAFEQMGEFEKALKDYDRAIELHPKEVVWFFNRGQAYHIKKVYKEAISDYSKAIELDPEHAWAYYNRGLAYYDSKAYGNAVSDYSRAIELDAKHSWALNNLALILAACPDAKYRDGEKAVEYARKACDLSGHKAANHVATLAAAYAEVGQFKQAVGWMQKALDLAKDSSKEEVERATRILDSYKAGKPYREE